MTPWMIEYLYDVADYFVLVEANKTFSGREKPFLYLDRDAHKFKRKDKIRINIVDFPEMPHDYDPFTNDAPEDQKQAWWKESYQRNTTVMSIQTMFEDSGIDLEDTVVYVGDADEIPNLHLLQAIKSGHISFDHKDQPPLWYLEMNQYSFNFNWKYTQKWSLPYIGKFKYIHAMGACNLRCNAPKASASQILADGGWHCGNFMSIPDIGRKLASFSHVDLDLPHINNAENIVRCIRDGDDLFGSFGSTRHKAALRHIDLEDIDTLPTSWRELHDEVIRSQDVFTQK